MIPEPRRLTAKAAIVLMTMTFMLCYFADTLKCSRGNTSTWCVGWGSIGLCGASSDCGDSVDNLAHVSMDESCRTHAHGSATLLLHVIEVRGGVGTTPLGPAVVEELSRKWAASHDSSPFAALLNTSALQDLVKDPDMAAVVLPGRANQSVLLSHDVVDLGLTSTQAGSTARSETVSVGLQELRQQLPLSGSLGGFHSLFPGLRAALQRLSREYGKSAHVCNAAGLVLMVIINPGSQVKPWMTFHDIDGGSSVEQLVLAHAHVRTSVARHISALRTLRAHLNAVWFVGAPLLFPAHTFINFNTSWTSNMATTVISIPPTQQVAGDMREKYCGNPPQQKMSACSDNCREWATHFMSSYAVSYEWRKVARDGHLTSPSEYSRILPYRECFAAVADAENNVPGRKLFDSCTFMNEEGAKLYAQCLVDWENDPHAA